jgi:hypothetical protein
MLWRAEEITATAAFLTSYQEIMSEELTRRTGESEQRTEVKKNIACTSFFFTFQGIRKPRRVDADDALIRVLFAGLPMHDCTLRSLL